MKKIALLIISCLVTIACLEGTKSSETIESNQHIVDHDASSNFTTAQSIANSNGSAEWKNVNEIRFTFNVDHGENHFERSWIWEPKTNNIKMIKVNDTVSYNRVNMDSITQKTDASFINDKYWFLAPFNLVWDEGTSFSEKENVVAPISKDTLNLLTVVYGSEGGYTPGDAYDFYFGKDYEIKEWVFRKSNDSLPSLTTTWEDYETFNGLKVAKMHKDSTANFKVYFTNISIK
jgi:hypothetical protein